MNLFIKRHKFLIISFLVIIILIPILVFAIGRTSEGYKIYRGTYDSARGMVIWKLNTPPRFLEYN
jgi:hypothetical protein